MTKPASNRFFFIPRSNERADISFATMHSITASLTIGLSIAQLSLAATLELPLDPMDTGRIFEGVGSLSAGASTRLLIDYRDDFESYAAGRTPRYFSDQVGTFEVVKRADGNGMALAQVLPAPGIKWEQKAGQFHPFTVIGDSDAKDYIVSVDVETADGVTVGLISRFGRIQMSESSTIAKGYRFEITAGSGTWKLSKPGGTIAEGKTPFPANTWHQLQLATRGQTITCRIDGKVVAEVKDASHTEGLAGLAAGYAGARFDNFSLIAE